MASSPGYRRGGMRKQPLGKPQRPARIAARQFDSSHLIGSQDDASRASSFGKFVDTLLGSVIKKALPFVERPSGGSRRPSTRAQLAGAGAGLSLSHPGFLALETRVVFDGAVAATADAVFDDHAADQVEANTTVQLPDQIADHTADQSADQAGGNADVNSAALLDAPIDAGAVGAESEIAFVDASLSNLDQLLAEIPQSVEVVLIDSGSDGVLQIADALDGRTDISAVHILSHGGQGELTLGTAVLDQESMTERYSDALGVIAEAFSDDADILVYGCDFAGGDDGALAVELLSNLTGADVAASNDLTGSAEFGGDWDLENQSGLIEATAISAAGWKGVLVDTDGDGVDDAVDIDDDNDGILDVDETVLVPATQLSLSNGAELNGASMTVTTNVSAGDVVRYLNVITVEGQQVDLLVEFVSSTGSVTASTYGSITVTGQPTNTDPQVRMNLSFVETGTNTQFAMPSDGSFSFNDIDSQETGDITEVIGIAQADFTGTSFGSSLESGGFTNSANTAGFDFYRVDPAEAGSSANWYDEVNVSGNPASNAVTVTTATGFTSGQVIFGHTGSSTNPYDRAINIGGFTLSSYYAVQDSDGDGVSDHLDLDSDNDGITDNVEAQATASYVAPTGIDSDGDGLDDAYEGSGNEGLTLVDTDGDGTLDFVDHDSDGDGTLDIAERGDGAASSITSNTDTDGDGLLDIFEGGDANDGYDASDENVTTSAGATVASPSEYNLAADSELASDFSNVASGSIDLSFRDGDTDNDGVADIDDIDDDNDGILDTEEMTVISSFATTGSWTILGNSATSDLGNGVIVRATVADGSGLSTNNFNPSGIGFWSASLAGADSLANRFDWNDTIVFSFEDADGNAVVVDNAIIHVDRVGGSSGGVQNSAVLTLGNGTWTTLAGTSDFSVTATTAQDAGAGSAAGGGYTAESSADDADGTASGSLQLDNATSSFQITANQAGPAGIGDEIEFIVQLTAPTYLVRDTDGDGVADHLDLDSDNDGITDNVEAQATSAYAAPTGTDSDGDGLDDAYEGAGDAGLTPVDTDGDGAADFMDDDSDGDGVDDIVERGDGAPTSVTSGADTDGDGLLDIFEGSDAADGYDVNDENVSTLAGATVASLAEYNLAADSQLANDFSNITARSIDLSFRDSDTDNDGLIDSIDIDDDNDGILDVVESDPITSTYSTSTSTIAASGTTVATPSTGYVVTDTSSGNTLSFTAVSPGENGSNPGTGTLSTITVTANLAAGEQITNGSFSLQTGAFDDGLFVSVDGLAIVQFAQNDWNNATINTKYGDGAGMWEPWNNEGNPVLEIDTETGVVRLMVDTAVGGREDILDDIPGSRPNPLPSLDFVAGITIASGYLNDDNVGLIDDQTLTFSATVINPRDSDGDGIADHLEIDSDNDGVTDNVEAQATAAYVAPTGLDSDGDGLDDAYEGGGDAGLTPVDTDSDTTDDYLDSDSDNDGTDDIAERGDGAPTSIISTTDTDADGLLDIFEGGDASDGFDVNDENLDGSNNFNLDGVPALAADGSNAVPLTTDLYFRDVNDAPSAANDTFSTLEDTATTFDVRTNDSDADGDSLTVTQIDGNAIAVGGSVAVTGGSVKLNADGTLTFTPTADWNGAPSFTYTVDDGEGGTATATVSGTVTAVNDAPVAGALADQSGNDSDVVSLDVSGSFSDGDAGDTLTYSATGLPTGLLINAATGVISGTIDSSASTGGPYSVTVAATDTSAASDSATFTWTVLNPAPTAVDDALAAGADDASAVVGNALGNDSDPDGDALAATVQSGIAGSNGGMFSVAANGDVIFDPNGEFDDLGAGATRDTTLTYVISDGEGGTDTATITVTVSGTNEAPVAGALADQADNDADVISLDVSGSFSDGDAGDTLTYSATGLPTGLSINAATGVISGTIDSSASTGGPYSVTVAATDTSAASDSATFTWTVSNLAPTAVDDALAAGADDASAVVGNALGNDSDPDGDALAATVQSAVAGSNGGLFSIAANGDVTFDPNGEFDDLGAGASRDTTLTYTISDGEGGTDTATITVTVSGTNQAPVAGALADQSGNDSDVMSLDVSGSFSDADAGDTLTYSATGLPTGLSINAATGVISGTIDSGASTGGPYSVTVTATDTSAASDSATLTWTVSNPAPTAVDDALAAGADDASAVVGNALGNDSDPDGDALAATVQSSVAGSNGGLFSIAANGDVTFDPNGEFDDLGAGATRDTTLTYAISDGEGGTDTATITVTVSGTNDAPVAGAIADQSGNDSDVVSLDVSGSFSDGDAGDTLTYSATGLPTGLSINAATAVISGTIDSSASTGGPYSVTVTATDTSAASDSAPFTWTVSNPAPTAVDDALAAGADDASAVVGNALGNDSDPDGDALAATVQSSVAGSSGGLFSIAANGDVTFDPNGEFDDLGAGATRDTTLTYVISDGEGGTDTATITVTVSGTNEAPVAVNDLLAASADDARAVVGNALGNDSDQNGDMLHAITRSAIAGTNGGLFSIAANGAITFDPNGDFDSLLTGTTRNTAATYTVLDGHGGTDTATIVVTVTGTYRAPTVASDDVDPALQFTPVKDLDEDLRFVDLNNNISAEGIVVRAVNELGALSRGSNDISADGIVEPTVNGLSLLGTKLDDISADGMVVKAVESIRSLDMPLIKLSREDCQIFATPTFQDLVSYI